MATSRLHASGLVSDISVTQAVGMSGGVGGIVNEHLFLHLDSSKAQHLSIDTSTATGNVIGNVTEWRNNWKGRNNQMVFLQDVASLQPEYHSAAVNGLPALWFPGFGLSAGPHLFCHGEQFPGDSKFHNISKSNSGATGGTSEPTGNGTDHYTVFCVLATTDNTDPGSSSGVVFSDNNQLFELQFRTWGDQLRYYVGRDVNKGIGNQVGDWHQHRYDNITLWTSGTESKLITLSYDGTYPNGYLNGVLFPDVDSGSAADLYFPNYSATYQSGMLGRLNDTFTLGGDRWGTTREVTGGFRGYLCELMMFDELLTATQIADIQASLNTKWGVP